MTWNHNYVLFWDVDSDPELDFFKTLYYLDLSRPPKNLWPRDSNALVMKSISRSVLAFCRLSWIFVMRWKSLSAFPCSFCAHNSHVKKYILSPQWCDVILHLTPLGCQTKSIHI